MAVQDNIASRQESKWNLTINGTDYSDNYQRLYFVDELMQPGEFKLELFGIDESNSDVSEDNPIEISYDGTVAYRGTIDETDFQSGLTATVEGAGRALILTNKTDSNEYLGSDTDTIVSNIVGSTMQVGTNTQLNSNNGNVDFRTDDEQKLRAINRLVTDYGGEWWLDEDSNGNNQLNVDTEYNLNSGTPVETYDVFGQDKNAIKTGNTNISKNVDVVVVKGYGDGDDQIREQYPDSPPSDPTAFVFTDKTILSSSVANTKAENLYNEMNDWQEITVKPMETDVVRKVGETVTIKDEDTGLNGDFRIVSAEYDIDVVGGTGLMLRCSNVPQGTVDKLKDTKKETKSQTEYMQGSKNVWGEKETGNCTDPEPLLLDFYVPQDVEDSVGKNRTNNIRLNYSASPFRQTAGSSTDTRVKSTNVSSSAAVESTDNVDVERVSQTQIGSTDEGGASSTETSSKDQANSSISLSDSSWTTIQTLNSNSDGAGGHVSVSFDRTDTNTGTRTIQVRLYENSFSIELYPGTGDGYPGAILLEGDSVNGTSFSFPDSVLDGDELELQARTVSGDATVGAYSAISVDGEHAHDVTPTHDEGGNFLSAPGSDGDIDETTGDKVDSVTDNTASTVTSVDDDVISGNEATSVQIIIDGTDRTNDIYGSSESGTKQDSEIDITDYLDDADNDGKPDVGWHTVEIKPDQPTFMKSRVFLEHKKEA